MKIAGFIGKEETSLEYAPNPQEQSSDSIPKGSPTPNNDSMLSDTQTPVQSIVARDFTQTTHSKKSLRTTNINLILIISLATVLAFLLGYAFGVNQGLEQALIIYNHTLSTVKDSLMYNGPTIQ